jgi:hypothetical protein
MLSQLHAGDRTHQHARADEGRAATVIVGEFEVAPISPHTNCDTMTAAPCPALSPRPWALPASYQNTQCYGTHRSQLRVTRKVTRMDQVD